MVVMHESNPSVPIPPPGAFACIVRPRGGAFACEPLPGGGAFEIILEQIIIQNNIIKPVSNNIKII